MSVAPADPPGDDLPDEIARLIEERTRGWSSERKAALVEQLREQRARLAWQHAYPAPGDLAQALDPHGTVQTPALELIDQALVKVDTGDVDRLVITFPPQEGKTQRVARWGGLWALRRNPDRRVAIASYADTLAVSSGRFVRDQIDTHGTSAPRAGGTDRLGLAVRKEVRSAGYWDLDGHRGGLIATGIGGGLTGRPVDWLIIDDPLKDRQAADSLTIRNTVWDWWTDVALPRLGPGGRVVVIMTRWHEDDLVGRLLEEDETREHRQWTVLNIPAEAESEDDPLGRRPGEFLTSARGRTDAEWARTKGDVGARTWAALYQGHPTPTEGGVFHWDWIRPYRVREAPSLVRVAVAVDTTGGGHDEAGVVAAGRGPDRRVYVLGDRSGRYTAGGQWRRAWMAVLDFEADVLVYERNLVDPIMRKAIAAAWTRMRQQAVALAEHGLLDVDLQDVDEDVLAARLAAAAKGIAHSGDDDVTSADDPLAALTAQLEELLPYARRILESPERGPARVEGVLATRGKTIRAEPCSQAYETGQVSHVGVFPALEQEQVTWQEGQDSPNRLDALVWVWTYLAIGSTPGTVARATSGRVATGTAALQRSRRR